jgi:hypothetical protein
MIGIVIPILPYTKKPLAVKKQRETKSVKWLIPLAPAAL